MCPGVAASACMGHAFVCLCVHWGAWRVRARACLCGCVCTHGRGRACLCARAGLAAAVCGGLRLCVVAGGEREERERSVTPIQPHKADSGAARTSPGRSQKMIQYASTQRRTSL